MDYYDIGQQVSFFDAGEWHPGTVVNAYPDSVHVRRVNGGDELIIPEYVKPRGESL